MHGLAFNPAFDITPAELVTAIFTEAGALSSARTGSRSGVSLRAEIVAAAQEMLRLGLVAGTSGNVSAREGELAHITPSGMPYPEIDEADLVTLSAAGEVVEGRREPSSERRVHLAVYDARPEVAAIVHTHSVHATAWSYLDEPLDTGTEEIELAAGAPSGPRPTPSTGSDAIALHAGGAEGPPGRPARGARRARCGSYAWSSLRHRSGGRAPGPGPLAARRLPLA